MIRIECCRFCVPPKRHPACHDTCKEYKDEKAGEEARKAEHMKKVEIQKGLDEERHKAIKKILKEGRRYK